MRFRSLGFCLCAFVCLNAPAFAGQPVFEEMPRWDDGWGFQIVPEYRLKSGLVMGSSTVDATVEEHAGLLHVEGVYTWDRSIRLTAKIPVVLYASRDVKDTAGTMLRETDAGLGDATLSLPLKRYYNLDGQSGSWTLSPQVRVPLGAKDAYDIYPRAWGLGLSGGVETETYVFIGGIGLGGWYFFDQKPASFHASASAGLNIHAFGSSGHVKVKAFLELEDDGSIRVRLGPIMYWRFTDLVHGQLTWKIDAYNWRATPKMGNENSVTAGVGFVY
jgi:hypothetical protein